MSLFLDIIQGIAGIATAVLAYLANRTSREAVRISKESLAMSRETIVSEALVSQVVSLLPLAREVVREHRALFSSFQSGEVKRRAVGEWTAKREAVGAVLAVLTRVDERFVSAGKAWHELEECEDSFILDSTSLSCPEQTAKERALAQFESKYDAFVVAVSEYLKAARGGVK